MKSASKREFYAVVALTHLVCQRDGKARVADISKQNGLPLRFLEQIFQRLRRGGIVRSERGRSGGFFLAVPASAVTLAQIFDVLEDAVSRSSMPRGPSAARVATEVLHAVELACRATTSHVTLEDIRCRALASGYPVTVDEGDFVI